MYTELKVKDYRGKQYMRTVQTAHKRAFLSNFELACEAAIVALVADLLWLLHDIVANGMSIWYGGVALGLILGVTFTIVALVRHHKRYTHRFLKNKTIIEE
jgi:hypothetical protein